MQAGELADAREDGPVLLAGAWGTRLQMHGLVYASLVVTMIGELLALVLERRGGAIL